MNDNQTNLNNELMTLILADMSNRKLIMGLDAIGLSTDDFNTNLSNLIFIKMEIQKQHETVFSNWYEDMVFNILDVNFKTFIEHKLFLAQTIYDSLHGEKIKLQAQL